MDPHSGAIYQVIYGNLILIPLAFGTIVSPVCVKKRNKIKIEKIEKFSDFSKVLQLDTGI